MSAVLTYCRTRKSTMHRENASPTLTPPFFVRLTARTALAAPFLVFVAAFTVSALTACATDGSSAKATTPSDATEAAAEKAIEALAQLAGERLAIADKVAASKWGTDKPIEDPPREKQVLDDTSKRAIDMGLDPALAQRIFRDQIEANKLVQRGLHLQWEASAEKRPTTRPDLAKEIRPELDRIGGALLATIRDAQPLLTSPRCKSALDRARQRTLTGTGMDALHREALDRALLHTCP
ncbi:chorismate mutase [Pendulispora albinea]|uniref:chorismate mutase n=1 Tax=Pendulispora albinea TaxID=2741071 RepID=A0ABZ2LLX3_9BACT